MRKLLLGTAAVAMGLAMSAPANAQVSLDLGGHFKGYVTWVDQDTDATTDERSLDILRETEIHFTGETTLDNGLTVGFHAEADVDDGEFAQDESYLYMSGTWGRVNFGSEDGAAYLMQVAAPSADSNIDGIRQYVQPVNYSLTTFGIANAALVTAINAEGFDYDNDLSGDNDKITYMTPVFNGFQAGVSYTPDAGNTTGSRSLNGVNRDDQNDTFGEAYEGAVRYEGQFEEVGFALGAGYTHVENEKDNNTGVDDFQEWNVGLDMDWGAFGIGVVYTENNNGRDTNDENETWVVGADYTTGPYKLGVSWYNNETDVVAANTIETDRFSGGVVYTYGPGMTFRGSLGYVEHDITGAADVEATYALIGTQVNF
ncbi:MAG: porin [Thioclava marina]|uniref:porin n=1 Tax=Thioclava marina TaxID=1915077 RepID=UPI0019A57B5F|nr:porin [Thioclava marina]MBC7147465.1 porin [Thioclava marina]